jgi:small-conductance mechanosensitive channel
VNAAQTTLGNDLAAAIAYLPSLVAGIIIFAIGLFVAFVGGKIAVYLAARFGLDRLGERRGVADDLQSLGVSATLSRLVGRLVFFVLALATLVQTVDALHLTPLANALQQLLGYMPRLVLAIVILVLGAAISDGLAEGVTVATGRAGILYGGAIGGVVRWLILVLAVLMALQQLTIDATFLLDVLVLVLGGFVVALAIAGGWGTRGIVENIVAGRYVSQTLAVGDRIESEDVSGTIERIDIASTTVRASDGSVSVIPNGYFLTRTVRKFTGEVSGQSLGAAD